MEENRPELAADLRKLSPEERARRIDELWVEIERNTPDPRYVGLSDDEVVAMIKRTRVEIWKEHVAGRR